MKNNKKHTKKDLAEAMIFPVTLTKAQEEEASKQLTAARKKGQKAMSESEKLMLRLLQLKFQLEDYLQDDEFNPEYTFGHFLRRYVDLLKIRRREFAKEISIDESLLSQFINEHRAPPEYIAIRLEIHSNNSIPATHWFKLVEKQKEFELKTDKEIRRKERKHVRRRLPVSV